MGGRELLSSLWRLNGRPAPQHRRHAITPGARATTSRRLPHRPQQGDGPTPARPRRRDPRARRRGSAESLGDTGYDGTTAMRLTTCLGCGRLVSPGPRCPDCKRTRTRIYDAARPSHHGVYGTAEWRRLSAAVRASATRCHWCGKLTSRLVADHVRPLAERPDLAYELSNVVPSCVGCNVRRGRNLAPTRWRQVTVDELVARKRRLNGETGTGGTRASRAGAPPPLPLGPIHAKLPESSRPGR